LDASLSSQLGQSGQTCTTYQTGGSTYQLCSEDTNIEVAAGALLGTVGGKLAAFDFGSYDSRRTPLAFVSPSRHIGDTLYTVCPVDYFENSLKSEMESRMGRYDGGYIRTIAPVCGLILYDIANTAQGDWYNTSLPDSPEDPHLAFIYGNVYADQQIISVGTSVSGLGPGFWAFNPVGSGTHNRNFSQVTADGQTYCFDSFLDPLNQPLITGFCVLIKMPTASSLRIEKINAANCGAGPWTQTSPTEFHR
jgi:hypothetical protein